MELFYNGIDILKNKNVILSSCTVTDSACGEADSLKLVFADYNALWGDWKPQFGDTVTVVKDGWTTGIMYIDEIADTNTSFVINSRSLPPKSRQSASTVWENARFSKIASDLALFAGLELVAYDITDYNYVRFDRKRESPIKCLNRLCMLEGYVLKITDGKAVIYNEKTFENLVPSVSIYPKKYEYVSKDIGRSAVNIRWFDGEFIQGYYSDPLVYGETETIIDIPVYNVAQAQRWSKGILRQYNKDRFVYKTPTDLNLSLAAANVINTPKGVFFISKIRHELIGSKSYLNLRKPIEGDY